MFEFIVGAAIVGACILGYKGYKGLKSGLETANQRIDATNERTRGFVMVDKPAGKEDDGGDITLTPGKRLNPEDRDGIVVINDVDKNPILTFDGRTITFGEGVRIIDGVPLTDTAPSD